MIDNLYGDLYNAGLSSLLEDKVEEGINYLKISVAFNITNFSGLNLLALAYYRVGRFAIAMQCCEKSIAIKGAENPALEYIETLRSLVNKLEDLNKKDGQEACDFMERVVLPLYPTHPFILNHGGLLFASTGNEKKARIFWEKALAVDPENLDALRYIKFLDSCNTSFWQKIKNIFSR